MKNRLNIVYMHGHDTGRWIEPYGYAVDTPNLQKFAAEGVIFRNAFCSAPSCSPSRAALLAGNYPHENGQNGLAHRGRFTMNDYSQHIVHTLKQNGYETVLGGLQHITENTDEIGYDFVLGDAHYTKAKDAVPRTVNFLKNYKQEKPLFLDIGFFENHKLGSASLYDVDYEKLDTRYVRGPANLPDTEGTRFEAAGLKASLEVFDNACGAILDALSENGFTEENTLIIVTTDHGLPVPGHKRLLTDNGTGIFLLMRGPGGFTGGKVLGGLVSHIDIFPTICKLTGISEPSHLRGTSLIPLVNGKDKLHDCIFTELTYHCSYVPMRSVRTERYKYIKRFDPNSPLNDSDEGKASEFWLENNCWPDNLNAMEQLYDLYKDPNEACNLINCPEYSQILSDLRKRLLQWQEETNDPVLKGPVFPPEKNNLSYVPEQKKV